VRDEQDIDICTNIPFNSAIIKKPKLPPGNEMDARCLFALLFVPTKEVSASVDAQMAQLHLDVGGKAVYNNKKPVETAPMGFVGVHLRLGGLIGEQKRINREHEHCVNEAVTAAVTCARRLEQKYLLPSAPYGPILLVTDNGNLRQLVETGKVTGVVGPPGTAIHVGHNHSDAHVLRETATELGLLARATCVVSGRSGFSNIARWWGNPGCESHMDACLAALKHKKKGLNKLCDDAVGGGNR
jgi:hypothetical protein